MQRGISGREGGYDDHYFDGPSKGKKGRDRGYHPRMSNAAAHIKSDWLRDVNSDLNSTSKEFEKRVSEFDIDAPKWKDVSVKIPESKNAEKLNANIGALTGAMFRASCASSPGGASGFSSIEDFLANLTQTPTVERLDILLRRIGSLFSDNSGPVESLEKDLSALKKEDKEKFELAIGALEGLIRVSKNETGKIKTGMGVVAPNIIAKGIKNSYEIIESTGFVVRVWLFFVLAIKALMKGVFLPKSKIDLIRKAAEDVILEKDLGQKMDKMKALMGIFESTKIDKIFLDKDGKPSKGGNRDLLDNPYFALLKNVQVGIDMMQKISKKVLVSGKETSDDISRMIRVSADGKWQEYKKDKDDKLKYVFSGDKEKEPPKAYAEFDTRTQRSQDAKNVLDAVFSEDAQKEAAAEDLLSYAKENLDRLREGFSCNVEAIGSFVQKLEGALDSVAELGNRCIDSAKKLIEIRYDQANISSRSAFSDQLQEVGEHEAKNRDDLIQKLKDYVKDSCKDRMEKIYIKFDGELSGKFEEINASLLSFIDTMYPVVDKDKGKREYVYFGSDFGGVSLPGIMISTSHKALEATVRNYVTSISEDLQEKMEEDCTKNKKSFALWFFENIAEVRKLQGAKLEDINKMAGEKMEELEKTMNAQKRTTDGLEDFDSMLSEKAKARTKDKKEGQNLKLKEIGKRQQDRLKSAKEKDASKESEEEKAASELIGEKGGPSIGPI